MPATWNSLTLSPQSRLLMCALELPIDKYIITGLPVGNKMESCLLLYQIPPN